MKRIIKIKDIKIINYGLSLIFYKNNVWFNIMFYVYVIHIIIKGKSQMEP